MKITKLMLSALVAAAALVSCNKEETTPVDGNIKTVTLSLENIIKTKGIGAPITPEADGTMPAVQVNNFKVFLTDASYSPGYAAKTADGTQNATFYFSSAADLNRKLEFHYVDNKCTKVVVVANMGDVSFEQVMGENRGIDQQQNPTTLVLYGEDNLSSTGRQHTNAETGKLTDVYEAKITLKPTISRFEVAGFVTEFSTPTPKFNKVAVTDIAFQHYFPHLGASTADGLKIAGTGSHVLHIANDKLNNDAVVHGWFNGAASTGWFRDHFATPLEMTPAAPKADAPNDLAYHFYSGEIIPTMIIRLLADGIPAHVYTSTYKRAGEAGALTKLEPGKIYRMSAAGQVDTDGSIIIPDDKIDPIERCIEVEVEVVDWVVELVTPEF